jgi:hypothetical protein
MSLFGFLLPTFPEHTKYYGVLARFRDVPSLFIACEQVRDAGYRRFDAHSPFPVHGLERAMGLRSSRLGWIVLTTGLLGALLGLLLQTWVHVLAYPLVISGKPLFAWPAFVPIMFELGVLGAALGAVLGMLGLNKLPSFYHPLFRAKTFERMGDDGLFISIEAWDPQFDPVESSAFLRRCGAVEVELVSGESAAEESESRSRAQTGTEPAASKAADEGGAQP